MPVGGLLEGVRGLQQRGFLEVVADQLQAHGQMAIAETDLERVTVQSVTIAYSRLHGMPMGRFHRRHTAWIGDRKLWPHIQAMLGEGGIDVEVRFGEPVEFTAATNRKEIARRLEGEVRSTMAGILHDPPVRK